MGSEHPILEALNDTWEVLGELVNQHLGGKRHPGTCDTCQRYKRIDNNLAATIEYVETVT